jgi:hypothetical protein
MEADGLAEIAGTKPKMAGGQSFNPRIKAEDLFDTGLAYSVKPCSL